MSEVAQTILEQLGGNMFVAMTGAKDFSTSGRDLTFKLPGGQAFKITLNGSDTYDIDHYVIRGHVVNDRGREEGIYCDMLRGVFERMSGFRTSLARAYA